MGGAIKAQELRELLGLARKLRDYADATGDPHYVDLFVETAEALEGRANRIADEFSDCGSKLNLVC
jgi:hypothetical protein